MLHVYLPPFWEATQRGQHVYHIVNLKFIKKALLNYFEITKVIKPALKHITLLLPLQDSRGFFAYFYNTTGSTFIKPMTVHSFAIVDLYQPSQNVPINHERETFCIQIFLQIYNMPVNFFNNVHFRYKKNRLSIRSKLPLVVMYRNLKDFVCYYK